VLHGTSARERRRSGAVSPQVEDLHIEIRYPRKLLLTAELPVLVFHTSHELATGAVPWNVGLPAESVDALRPSQALYPPLATSGRRPLHHTSPANAASLADARRKA